MVRYLFYTIGDLTYQSPLVYSWISQLCFRSPLYFFIFFATNSWAAPLHT